MLPPQPLSPQPAGLGRLRAVDDRDRLFPMRVSLPAAKAAPKTRHWRVGPVLDQGQTGTCVGHAWRNWMNAMPVADKPGEGPTPFAIYDAAILLDEFPENDHDTQRQMGTSVRAGVQVLRGQGYVKSFVWAQSMNDLAAYVLAESPVVFGTNWYSGMFEPDARGLVRPTGNVVGGHAYLCCGYDSHTALFECFNSWGAWGYRRSGKFYLRAEDAETLVFAQGGEACDALEQAVVQPHAPAGALEHAASLVPPIAV